jgi:hypothetical protein
VPNQNFLVDADIYDRIGGQAVLTQLIDPQFSGVFSQDILKKAEQDACNEIIAAAGVQADLNGFTIPDFRDKFPHLITIAAQYCIYLCWLYGTSGQACPERILGFKTDVDLKLEQLALRKRKHGAADFSPYPAQRVTQVNNNPNHRRSTLIGFQRGGFC